MASVAWIYYQMYPLIETRRMYLKYPMILTVDVAGGVFAPRSLTHPEQRGRNGPVIQ